MTFNSIEYLIFLPVTFLLYWQVFGRIGRKAQNLWIVATSYLFYGMWDWRFLVLIFITSLCSYASGLAIERTCHKKLFMWANIVLNLGILGMFKYYDFFASSMATLMSHLGITLDDVTLGLILPVGISFYTFQALSYTIDVYRGKLAPTTDPVAFFAFISFFPQLVAGPIERATNLLPQFLNERRFDYGQAVDGMRQILWGLFKKVLVADNCAIIANGIFANYATQSGLDLLVGALMFTFQIYGDFSGYSDIAIGTAKLFGISLMTNFRVPYFSRDIAEFWRRWHISLTTWFRDYVYIPLGGSRVRRSLIIRNTFVIFLLSGMWHGANWTFVTWGAYNALLFLPLILAGRNRKYKDTVAEGRMLPTVREVLSMMLTFALVVIGWIIFRADNITDAWHYIVRMFTHMSFTGPLPGRMAMMWVAIMLMVEWLQRGRQHGFDFDDSHGLLKYQPVRWFIYACTFLGCLMLSGVKNDFIYFQF